MSELKQAVTFTNPNQDLKPIDPSTTEYLVLLKFYEEDGETTTQNWEVVVGRKEVYEYLKMHLDCLSLTESKILTAKVPFEGAKSVYEFLSMMRDKFEDWEFELDAYVD